MIGGNDHAPEFKTEKRGITQFEFAQIIERVARLNGVPVINAFCEAGFGYARVKARDYQVDHIHLNELGGKNMGKFIWSKLKDIPTWEAE
jgi:lysophospholipase L1-like esterase